MTAEPDWTRARCRNMGPGLFYGSDDEGNHRRRVAEAKTVCGQCPIQCACRAWGAEHEQHGIWGGQVLDSKQRRLTHADWPWVRLRDYARCSVCGRALAPGDVARQDPHSFKAACEGCTT